MKKLIYKFSILLATVLSITIISCKKDEPKKEEQENIDRTILVYAVASNNLEYDLTGNKVAMLKGMENVDMKKYQLIVYEVNNKKDHAILWKAVKNQQNKIVFDSVGYYDRNLYSTDPKRIKQVITDVKNKYPSDHYDLFLWSHATSWLPGNTCSERVPVKKSFGIDNYGSSQDKTDITELASAIPDGLFDMIWFDCCLMSNIECAYELKDKCDWLAAYPTEIYSEGTPYAAVIPYLLKDNPDRERALEEVYDFYTYSFSQPRAVSVCLMDMSKINRVANVCKQLYKGDLVPSANELLKYSRPQIALSDEMYDFGQYSILRASLNNNQAFISEFEKTLSEFVVYKAISDKDFNYNTIDKSNFSGVSCHLFNDSDSSNDDFYRTLAWYKAVY